MVCSAPTIGAMRSTLSMPFCKVMTRVLGPTSGFACAAAVSVSHSFTANSTMSTGPTLLGSSVAFTFGRCRSPCTLSIVRPLLCSAARLAPRAMKNTS